MKHAPIAAAGVSAFAITVDRKAFVAALTLAKRVTERRNTIPILSNVLLHVLSPDVLNIIATDLDLDICQEFPCDAAQPGAMTLNGETILATLKKMKGETVRLQDMGANKVAVTDLQAGSTMSLPSLPPSDFPILAFGDFPARFVMDARTLADTIETVRPAVSTEETRYYLNGVFIHPYCESPRARTDEHEALTAERAALGALDQADVEALGSWRDAIANAEGREDETAARSIGTFARGLRRMEIDARIDELEAERTAPDALRFAATDGHRLFCYSRPLPAGAAVLPAGILPRKAAALVAHIVPKKSEAEAHCSFSESKFRIRVGRVTLQGKLIDGTFPDYTRVIPSANRGRLAIADASAFRSAVEGVAAVCTEKAKAVTCTMTDGYVTLYAHSPECGSSGMIVGGAAYSFDPGGLDVLPLGANAKYVLDALEPFGSEAVEIRAEDAASPFRFYSDARPGLTIVLMPLRVGGPVSPFDIARLTMNALEALRAEGPRSVADLARIDALIAGAGSKAEARLFRKARTIARKALGKMLMEAKPLLGEGSRMEKRWHAKRELAAVAGDEAGERIASAVLASLQAGPSGSLAALAARPAQPLVIPSRPAPDVSPAKPGAEPAKARPVDAPKPAPQAEAEAEAEPLPQPAPVAEPETVTVAKIADVYGRVFYVVESDLLDEGRAHVRRVHKDGTPFCSRESEGGGWQRILRENIARRILPRGSVDAPAKVARAAAQPVPAAAQDLQLAERVAALEALVMRLAGGEAMPQPEPVEVIPAAVLADIAARGARYGIAQIEGEETLEAFLTRLQGFEAAERDTIRTREREATREIAELRADVFRLVDEKGGADEAIRLYREEAHAAGEAAMEERERARQAVDRAARLQVRCDALEGHAAASSKLDAGAPPRLAVVA